MKSEKDLLQAVLEARVKVEEAERVLDSAKEEKTKVESSLIESMDLRDVKSFKIEGLATVIRIETLYVNVTKEDRDKLLLWVDEEAGRSDLIKRTIHGSTLKSFIGQRIKEGEGVPSFINQYYKPALQIRRG